MINKLSKLERKLSNLDIEDINRIDVSSSLSDFREILDKFVHKYNGTFRIIDALDGLDTRDMFVLKLVKKIEYFSIDLKKGSYEPRMKQGKDMFCVVDMIVN